jgi:hypothetical protein
MAKSPVRQTPQDAARAVAGKVRNAFNAAKNRTGGEGRLVALSAGGLLLAFVLLAVLAPVLMQAPAIVSSLIGFVLFGLVLAATAIGGVALWRIIKAGAMDSEASAATQISIFSQSAVEAALSNAEDAGLRAHSPRVVQDAMTGRIHARPIAVMRVDGLTYGVVRLHDAVAASFLLAPGSAPWPFAFPDDGALTPVPAPEGIAARAWSTDRDHGIALAGKLEPALAMSNAGGEVPFVSVRRRSIVLMWRQGDVGTAGVIMAEVAKAFG